MEAGTGLGGAGAGAESTEVGEVSLKNVSGLSSLPKPILRLKN